ncbi:NosD domain-containing protein [Massilia sp. CMS3.1]|uniref:NosD domain-containing protein n=1 Tax=Massilia sp. CMS3.1 TaxID=3373083 RepID=UPI003EE654BD
MRLFTLLAVPLVLAASSGAAGLYILQSEGVTPRALAPYIEKRTSGHNSLIEGAGRFTSTTLLRLDRGDVGPYVPPALTLGAQPDAPRAPAGNERLVASSEEAWRAIANAAPGDVITFLPGEYALRATVYASLTGTASAPIVVRAARPGSVRIDVAAAEGFKVTAPYWRFENLQLRGTCKYDDTCDHAFHVVGKAHHFVARNNTIRDFNAHFKINGEGGAFPDHGLIESNTLSNAAPRQTSHPVTPIDLVAASDWTIRANLIQDFVKTGGDRISYGAFAKGGAERTVFERNVVLCEAALAGQPGQRVGLSFGGGATGKPYCRDGRCITEHDGGIMRANLVSGCSDVGIYLNSAANTTLSDNTILNTAGVQVRFPTSGATLEGNLVDGPLWSDEGGMLRAGDNLHTPVWQLYFGWHPQRGLFADPARLDLRWRDEAAGRDAGAPASGLCENVRETQRDYGAFDNFARCLRRGTG